MQGRKGLKIGSAARTQSGLQSSLKIKSFLLVLTSRDIRIERKRPEKTAENALMQPFPKVDTACGRPNRPSTTLSNDNRTKNKTSMSDNQSRLPSDWKIWSADGRQESELPSQDSTRCLAPEKTCESPAASADQTSRLDRELDQLTGTGPKQTRSIPLRVLVPLLIDAFEHNRTWLQDFADDIVSLDADLHEVLLAYQSIINQDRDMAA